MSSLDESIDATHEHEACVDCDIDNQTDGIEFDHICPELDDLFDNTCTDDLLDNNHENANMHTMRIEQVHQ